MKLLICQNCAIQIWFITACHQINKCTARKIFLFDDYQSTQKMCPNISMPLAIMNWKDRENALLLSSTYNILSSIFYLT